ncbi:CLUMA_CG002197, isoform A [Clunio marinus]|uniref:CLUMA_CG002197, isoform A n=1 Tax=Clunio marinus TaxID=568069 RepID=A0A1J1HLY8_9DIPT|nr:CLUMA_CG002197, isoform A [Clunio marinus]
MRSDSNYTICRGAIKKTYAWPMKLQSTVETDGDGLEFHCSNHHHTKLSSLFIKILTFSMYAMPKLLLNFGICSQLVIFIASFISVIKVIKCLTKYTYKLLVDSLRYSHIILFGFFLIYMVRCEKENLNTAYSDNGMFDVIYEENVNRILKTDYPNQESIVECMITELKKQQAIKHAYADDLLNKIEPYVVDAEKVCKQKNFGLIFHSSISLIILCAIAAFIRS